MSEVKNQTDRSDSKGQLEADVSPTSEDVFGCYGCNLIYHDEHRACVLCGEPLHLDQRAEFSHVAGFSHVFEKPIFNKALGLYQNKKQSSG